MNENERPLIDELTGALRFIMAFYEPSQRYLDTEAWKHAEAGGRRALARGEAALASPQAIDWDSEPKFDWNNTDGEARQRHVHRHEQWAEDQIEKVRRAGAT